MTAIPIVREVWVNERGISPHDGEGYQIRELCGPDTSEQRAVVHEYSDTHTVWRFARNVRP